MPLLKAPFPWFGGKSRIADQVWRRFSDITYYVEPFFGSGAVLLARPHIGRLETVNDADCYLANFWRALKDDPSAVAAFADAPVNEADLLAKHKWLVKQTDFHVRMKTDPFFYDARIAGWWVWGQSSWIASGWCDADRDCSSKQPRLEISGTNKFREIRLVRYMESLAVRLRTVRVCCGDWSRVCGPSTISVHKTTGVFLDPPYGSKDENFYSVDSKHVAMAVRNWAVENGNKRNLRIALCGYEGEHEMPPDWEKLAWKAQGGYGSQRKGEGRANSAKERIWFSPHCRKPRLL